MLEVEILQGVEIGADVFADGGMGAAACFDGFDARRGQSRVGG